jgi:hypothetical protein
MKEKRFQVVVDPALVTPQHFIASRAEVHGDHLVLLDSAGRMAALFLLDIVESWKELGPVFDEYDA